MITLLYALISPVLIAIGLQKKSYLFFSLPIMMDLLEIFFATLFLLVTCLLGVAGYEDSKHLEQVNLPSKFDIYYLIIVRDDYESLAQCRFRMAGYLRILPLLHLESHYPLPLLPALEESTNGGSNDLRLKRKKKY